MGYKQSMSFPSDSFYPMPNQLIHSSVTEISTLDQGVIRFQRDKSVLPFEMNICYNPTKRVDFIRVVGADIYGRDIY